MSSLAKAFSLFLVFLILLPPFLFAQPAGKATARLDRLIKDLDSIQQEQENILKHQDETLEVIKNLKVWARR